MTIKKIYLAIILGVLVFIMSVFVWAQNSPAVQDYYLIHNRDTEFDVAYAFTVALRNNDAAAYEIIDPKLTPRLDDWMDTHRGKKCTQRADTVFLGKGTEQGYKVIIDCFGERRWLTIRVDNIAIKDMRIVDWGKVEEE